ELEEARAVLDEAVAHHHDHHQHGEREGDDDVAGKGEEIRHHAVEIADEDEQEQREHEGEELHALGAGVTSDHVGHEFIGHFRSELPTVRHQPAPARGEDEIGRDGRDRQHHEQGRIGETDGEAAMAFGISTNPSEREEIVDDELMNGIVCHACLARSYMVLSSSGVPWDASDADLAFNSATTRVTLRIPAAKPSM